MPIIDDRTAALDLPLPNITNNTEDDVLRIIESFNKIDAHAAAVLAALLLKAAAIHSHAISDITGLAAALTGKLDVGATFALDDLTDVDAAAAANNQFLMRSGGSWIPAAILLANVTGWEDTVNALIASAVASKASLASPAFTGNPTVPTQPPGNNSTRAANTAFVTAAINALVAAAPGVLDTLDEIAAALGDDPNFATTMLNALAGKEPADPDIVKADATKSLAAGYTAPSFSLGNSGVANLTLNPALRNKQHISVTGAFTILPPAADCDMTLDLVMSATAGAVSFSGWGFQFQSDPITTTSGHRHRVYVNVTNGFASYFTRKLQT